MFLGRRIYQRKDRASARLSAPSKVELGREWGLSGGRKSTGLRSVIPRLFHIDLMSGPPMIHDGALRIWFPHGHKKAFD